MGFFKKAATSYPAQRNRMSQQQQPTVHEPSYNNTPITTMANALATQQQPVPVATAYVSGASSSVTAAMAPVMAAAYVPSSTAATATGATTAVAARPVLATAYIPTNAFDDGHTRPSAPPMNPSYNPNYNATNNNNYNTHQDEFWECVICTFPNLQRETHCKGCGNIHPGCNDNTRYSNTTNGAVQASSVTASSSYSVSQMNSQMAKISLEAGTYPNGIISNNNISSAPTSSSMKVHIPNGMRPGQQLKVRSPTGNEVVKTIPNQSEWCYETDGRPYFRMEFGTSHATQSVSSSSSMKVHIPNGMRPGQQLKVRSPTGNEVVKTIPNQSEWCYETDGRPYFRMEFGTNHATQSVSNNISSAPTSSSMKVHIPNGMRPGQQLKVRSPTGNEVVKTIPNQSEWCYETDGRPYFRMEFGPFATTATTGTSSPNNSYTNTATTSMTSYRPPAHSTTWREFHARPISRYNPPPIGMQSVPHTPRGLGSGGISPNGRHKALLIGINYTGTRAALRGCINDALNMQTLLLRNGFPNDGSHMLMLTDERHRGNEYQPNASNIMKAMAWLMQGAQRGDVLFFHYSGHGGQVPDKTGHEADGYNETIIPADHSRAGQITDDVLWGSLVYNLPEGARLTALMDMCHSGTGLDLPYDYNLNTRRWTEDINPAHSRGDVVLFSGCEDSQTSADVQNWSGAGGAMTKAFTKAYMQCPMTTYHEFLCVVKSELRKNRHSQRPQLTSSQRFDASSRIFSLGQETEGGGGIPSMIEPNHNPQVGRQKRRHVRPARQGFGVGGGGGNDLFGFGMAAIGAALFADAMF